MSFVARIASRACFTAAMLNNYPMGFYHPATLVKDAQRHTVLFAPIYHVPPEPYSVVISAIPHIQSGRLKPL